MNFTDKLTKIAQEILAEQDQDKVLDSFVKLRSFLSQEEIIQRIVNDEAIGLQRYQRFLFYTLESLLRDVWRQLNTDSLLFLEEKNLIEENVRIARLVAESVLSLIEYAELPQAATGQKALERWAETVNTFLTILTDVNSRSIEQLRNRSIAKEAELPPSIPSGNFDPTAVRLAEYALLTAFNPSTHVLSTAGRSTYFFDFDRFVLNKTNAPLVRKALVSQIGNIQRRFGVDYLGILEKRGENTVGCVLTSEYLSSQSGIPVVLIRLARHLLVDRVKTAKGEILEGKRVLPITDNISNGNEIRSAVRSLRYSRTIVTDVLTVLFRGDDAVRGELEQDGIVRVHALLSPEILHFTASSLIPRVRDVDTRDMLKAAVAEIEKRHLVEVRA